MPQTLEEFAREVQRILKRDPGPSGRDEVRRLLEALLREESFVAEHLQDEHPPSRLLYRDAELGFSVIGYVNRDAQETHAPPHDHGASWAIYGQAVGSTFMDEWEVVVPGTPERPGKVRKSKSYELAPGNARLYNERDIHSPSRYTPTKFVRVEGGVMEGRLVYESVS